MCHEQGSGPLLQQLRPYRDHGRRQSPKARASVAGTEVTIKRVAEIVPEDVAKQSGFKLDQKAPIATPEELADYDGVIFGTPTRFGNMAAQMRNFLDQTGGRLDEGLADRQGRQRLRLDRDPAWRPGATILSFHTTLLHQGMVIVGLPYSATGAHRT